MGSCGLCGPCTALLLQVRTYMEAPNGAWAPVPVIHKRVCCLCIYGVGFWPFVKCLDESLCRVYVTLRDQHAGAETSSSVWAPRLLRDLLRKQGFPVGYSASQVQEERTKEEDRALACSPAPITAERRRSLWYATHYPTDERKVSRQDRGCLSFIFCFLSYC